MTVTNWKILFMDDSPTRAMTFRTSIPSATIVQTAAECIEKIKTEWWERVHLDHDLNGEVFVDSSRNDCGMEVVRFLEDNDFSDKIGTIFVHTMYREAGLEMTARLCVAGYEAIYVPFDSGVYYLPPVQTAIEDTDGNFTDFT